MPGRRLTEHDRQHIAAGLAQGLDLAEIARKLDRPTSTVTREVTRNGGPGRYRADLAQLATTHRARRKPRPAPTRPISEHRGPGPAATASFIRELTAAFAATGLPRTAAGVLACLFTAETGGRTAAELVRELRVSAATISVAVALLEEQGLIVRVRAESGRRQRYFIDANASHRTVLASARTNQHLANIALRGAEIFGAATPVGARLEAAGRFLEHLGNDIVRSVERWHATIDAD
ncbi:helix-turn-helix domain-containing protein [Nocardia sp. CA-107356]|uniref:GbsR/MarR family transcriptional regulator n=1 Tax=Nocardia sp. CA-107356 TaxID=3239972 RepID=UPI003D933C3D